MIMGIYEVSVSVPEGVFDETVVWSGENNTPQSCTIDGLMSPLVDQ
jgi:hypothetical protein